MSLQSKILQAAYHQVQSRMGLQQDRQEEVYNRRRHREPFQEGDYVMLHTPVVPRGSSRKLHCLCSGSYKVLKRLSVVTYRICRCQGRKRRIVVHFNRLKLCPVDLRAPLQQSRDTLGQSTDYDRHWRDTEDVRPSHEGGTGPLLLDSDESEEKEPEELEQSIADFPSPTTDNASNTQVDLSDTLHTDEIELMSDLERMSTTRESSERRYPSREHRPPSRYDNYVRM